MGFSGGLAVVATNPFRVFIVVVASCVSFLILTNISSRSSITKLPAWASKAPPPSQADIRITWEKSIASQSPSSLADIKNSTLGFEKVLVINLPERSDKRDALALASSLTNMTFTFVDGVKGESVTNKSLPWGQEDRKMKDAMLGSWRAHMDAIRKIIENGWSSALIMEDDVDWDLHLKSQLSDFAHGSRFLQNQTTDQRTHSPYGDGWDLLWLGHCHDTIDEIDSRTYAIERDPTVPANKRLYLNNHDLLDRWPDHTRVVHVVGAPICTFAYALSYQGAQKVLYALSVKELKGVFDNALSWWCTGHDQNARCLSAHPAYFAQHRVRGKPGKNSDNNPKVGGAITAHTVNIRYSTRLNLENLLTGSTDYVDSYPAEEDYATNDNEIQKTT